MLKKVLSATVATAAITVANPMAFAAPCSCEAGTSGRPETILEGRTNGGTAIRARFEADPVTRAASEAVLCTAAPARVARAQLWMPGMGHGSSPTRLTAETPTCTRVERINFLMSGAWEIRVTLASGDTASLALEVAP